MSTPNPLKRAKLGLALAGGGFRASFFHVGVLRRMAELDLLRYVEVLSTVSGGSIVGALYFLILKRELERAGDSGRLTREQYVAIIDEAAARLKTGVQKNLRTRLLMNPWWLLKALLGFVTLGEGMARLYERHLFKRVLAPSSVAEPVWAAITEGKLRLVDARIRRKEVRAAGGTGTYNATQLSLDRAGEVGSAATQLVVNATSLNSGARFWFSATEVGDYFLGYVRENEITEYIEPRRELLLMSVAQLWSRQRETARAPARTFQLAGQQLTRHQIALALWWKRRRFPAWAPALRTVWPYLVRLAQGHWWGTLIRGLLESLNPWQLFGKAQFVNRLPLAWQVIPEHEVLAQRLLEVHPGRLRAAKIPAWHLRYGLRRNPIVTGGASQEEHLSRFWFALEDIAPEVKEKLQRSGGADSRQLDLIMDIVLEFYWFRSAEVASSTLERDWHQLTLGDAVGASACFPPVFPPYPIDGLYADSYVRRLSLTDGGIFDNMGLVALIDEGCNYVIASDTSGYFDERQRDAAVGHAGMIGRIMTLLPAIIARQQQSELRERRRASRVIEGLRTGTNPLPAELREYYVSRELRGLAYFHIASEPRLEGKDALPMPFDAQLVAQIRTDLDAFGDIEIAAIVNQGYALADQYLRDYLHDSPFSGNNPHWQAPDAVPCVLPAPAEKINTVLRVGSGRFLRALHLRHPLPVALTGGLLVAIIWALYARPAWLFESMRVGWHWLYARITPWTDLSWLWRERWPALTLIGAGLAWLLISSFVRKQIPLGLVRTLHLRGWERASVWLARTKARIKNHRRVALFFFGWLPLLLITVVSAFAIVNHWLFTRPFLHATRMESLEEERAP